MEQRGTSQLSNQLRPAVTPNELMGAFLQQMGIGISILAVGPKGDSLPPQLLLPPGWTLKFDAYQAAPPQSLVEQGNGETGNTDTGDSVSDVPGDIQ